MTDVSVGFRPPCWCPSRWAPTWRLHTNLYKFGENVSPHIFHKKNCCDLNLGESLCICTFFLFPDSGLNLLNSFDFLFLSILNCVTLKTSNTSAPFPQNLASIPKCVLRALWVVRSDWLIALVFFSCGSKVCFLGSFCFVYDSQSSLLAPKRRIFSFQPKIMQYI